MAKQLNMAVIGTGMAWDKLHLPAIKELGDRYKVVALCDIKRERALKAAQERGLDERSVYTDHKEMLKRDDIDLVDILVPICKNFVISRDVAESKHDFICEKPLAPNMEQAREFLTLPVRYGVKVMIAENFKYAEENNLIKRVVDEGRIGKPIYFIMNNANDFPSQMSKDSFAATEWRQHPDFSGGAFLDAALHDLAMMRHIFGPVDKVQAFGTKQDMDFMPYLSVNVNMMFTSGVIGQYTYWPSGKEWQKPPIGFRVFGSEGEIYLEDKSSGIVNVAYRNGKSEQLQFRPERGYYNELLNFYNSLTGAESISVTPAMEYGDVKMVFDILTSIRSSSVEAVDTSSMATSWRQVQRHQEQTQYNSQLQPH